MDENIVKINNFINNSCIKDKNVKIRISVLHKEISIKYPNIDNISSIISTHFPDLIKDVTGGNTCYLGIRIINNNNYVKIKTRTEKTEMEKIEHEKKIDSEYYMKNKYRVKLRNCSIPKEIKLAFKHFQIINVDMEISLVDLSINKESIHDLINVSRRDIIINFFNDKQVTSKWFTEYPSDTSLEEWVSKFLQPHILDVLSKCANVFIFVNALFKYYKKKRCGIKPTPKIRNTLGRYTQKVDKSTQTDEFITYDMSALSKKVEELERKLSIFTSQ